MAISKETILEVLSPICGTVKTYEHRGDLAIFIEPEDLLDVARELRDNPRTLFNQLIDVTAIDWYKREKRFEVNHFLYSHQHNGRVRLKVLLEQYDEPHCPSVVELWESANWYERETYDMYGIIFDGHPDMRRFYMPEDFVEPETGDSLYPLRKDFPLMGIPGSLPMPERPEHVNPNS